MKYHGSVSSILPKFTTAKSIMGKSPPLPDPPVTLEDNITSHKAPNQKILKKDPFQRI